ncbi:hypothetical protein [Blautia sp.]|uniref:hypothetical protein n=1 Tax=Blautia sp. TaxID=1955243 RepID=UPI002586DB75|nr:hypothetical protein [Blautia sp.]
MQTYEITHIIENEEWESRLAELAQRCRKLNGWTEKDLLQFAVTSMPMYRVWLMYLEDIVIDMEQEEKNKSFLEKLHRKEQKEGNTSV